MNNVQPFFALDETSDFGLFIGGRSVAASDGSIFEVFDPASGEAMASVSDANAADANAAVDAAADAAAGWAATAPRVRSEILRHTFELMLAQRDDLATLIVRENGKAWSEARAEVTYAAEFFRWFAEEAVRAAGVVQTAPGGDKHIITLMQPVGVSVLITPWNFPAAMATRKIAPALAAGCTAVLKPASDTPLTALAVAQLMKVAGLPDGVLNVVPSRRSGAVAQAMLDHPRTRKLSFTGSTEVGRGLLTACAPRVISASMELGGNAPFIVFADSELDDAVDGGMVAKMRNGGASCIAANRFLVEAPVADEFAARLSARMSAIRVGPGLDRRTELGAMISPAAIQSLNDFVASAVSDGAKVLIGGSPVARSGCFFEPTVITAVPASSACLQTEVFGPVAPITTFEDEAEAVDIANATAMGLAAYVYSGDLRRAIRVAERLESGMVGINRGLLSDPAAPFGGVKQSGLGREGGHAGLIEFIEEKYLAVDWHCRKAVLTGRR